MEAKMREGENNYKGNFVCVLTSYGKAMRATSRSPERREES